MTQTAVPAPATVAAARPARAVLAMALSTLGIMLLTAAVMLVRATGPLETNWPITYNLTNSDNGVLYQLAQDVFSGRPLDWSFSPQTYTVPEIPISLLAYLLAFGNLYWYYVVVAALNVGLLFLALLWLVRHLFPAAGLATRLTRAAIAASPLVLLPLLTQNSVYLYQLAPTYYYGVYLFTFLLPIALFASRRWVSITLLAGYAVTAAADPLLLAMTLPGAGLVLLVMFLRDGWTGRLPRMTASLGLTLAASVLVRLVVLSPMVAADPSSYISARRAVDRERAIYDTFRTGFHDRFDQLLLGLSIAAVVVCVIAALKYLRTYFAHPHPQAAQQSRTLALIYLTSLPFLGVFAMYVIMAVHLYYLWLFGVGSIVVAALVLPSRRWLAPTATTLAVLLVVFSGFTLARNAGHSAGYFGFRPALTQCIDEHVPDGALGYSTFSDGRGYGLTSQHGVRFIQLNPDLSPNFWLTNRAIVHHQVGSFVLVNPHTSEPPLSPEVIADSFGEPERVVRCGEDVELWFYDSAEAQARIADFYQQYADSR